MMQVKSKSFNLQAFLELLSCLSFAGIIFYLLKSERYLNYVTPRMKPYFNFTLILMVIWAFTDINRLFRPQYQIRLPHCLVLLIPVLILFMPHSTINTSDLVRKYSVSQIQGNLTGKPVPGDQGNPGPVSDYNFLSDDSTEKSQTAQENTAQDSTSPAAPEEESTAPQKEFSDVLPGLDEELKTITVSNDDFGFWVSEINMNPQKYVNYTIKMTGFVYIDDTFQKDEFMASRLLMTCCVADLSPVGLICKYDKTPQLKSNSWVTVEGVLFTSEYEYNGQTCYTPELTVTEITPAKEVEGYVYAY